MIDPTILCAEDCQACRRCCRFDPDEIGDAPAFTEEQKERILREFGDQTAKFSQRGKLWQVQLFSAGSANYECPFFDSKHGLCRVHSYCIIDCLTWPFYVMADGERLVIALSRDCPVVSAKDQVLVLDFAHRILAPMMHSLIERYPDLVTKLHGNVEILFTLD